MRRNLSTLLFVLAVSLVAPSSASGQATIIIQNNDAPGIGFNDSTPVAPVGGNGGTTLGQQRLNAFNFAASIWGATLTSGPMITVDARWDSTMPCTAGSGTLGSASTTGLARNFSGAPFTNTWFPAALANALTGSDANLAQAEIRARFNPDLGTTGCLESRGWYLGLDGNHGAAIDLISVVLHEFGHGLGFQGFTDTETGEFIKSQAGTSVPGVWDRFLLDNTTGKRWVDMTPGERVASAINTGNLVWAGPQVTSSVPSVLFFGADSQNRALMFAPNPVDPGSSVSHYDRSASPNQLMEPNFSNGLNHTLIPPSDLTFPLLRDIGWNPAAVSPPPNDNFSAAQVINGCSGTTNGTNVSATKESGEPDHASNGGTRSVWYQWQAPNTGAAEFTTVGSLFDTVLGVYTGTAVNSLTTIGTNDDVQAGTTTSKVAFQATAGTIYRIAVGGFNNNSGGDFGTFTLNWTQDCTSTWVPTVLNANQVELKSWTIAGRTFAYAKLTFPDAGFRVSNWSTPVRVGNDSAVDALVERWTGGAAQVITTTANIWDLGLLGPGSYTFTFKNSGTTVKTLAFTVSATPPAPNPIDDARTFVFWQYKDFLRRDPDAPGWDHWTGEITECSDPAKRKPGETEPQCVDRKRANTSGAFFLSPEFQNTGYFVLRVYRGSLGRMPFYGGTGTAQDEFTRDAATVGEGIVVNFALDPARINANKAAFANQFVTRPEFKAIYDGLNNTQYVDKLFQTTGVVPAPADRQALIDGLNGGSETRASVLFKVVDGTTTGAGGLLTFNTTYGKAFYDNLFLPAFVQMEYFGYLLRDPDPDGYAFWLGKLTFFGNFVDAEMVRAFILSPEYRSRFGAP